ncbi:sigma-70 family RNA polymerase sigma factor [Chitinophaga oryziterrae]
MESTKKMVPLKGYNLATVLDGCRRGIPTWQKALYEQYYGFANSICVRYASTDEDAREVLNDGFVKVFKGILSFVVYGDESTLPIVFMAWLKRIMINTSINHSKLMARRISWTVADNTLNSAASHMEDPMESMAYNDLVKLIQQLSPAYRSVFCLFAIDGFTHEEISRILGISLGTSKSNLLKARRNLRKMLEQQMHMVMAS